MSDEEKSFTVKDRRHFTAEGEQKEEVPEAETPVAPARPAESEPARSTSDDEHAEDHEAADPQQALPTLDFSGLLISLGTQAGALLGDADGAGADLDGARGIISLLEILKVKTQGNRTPDEDALIEGMLYQLRMAYMTVARTRP